MSTRKKFGIFCATCLCCFWLGIVIDLACGPEPDPYDYYVSFFHNNIQKTNDYKPFYFNGAVFLNDYENPASETTINAKEWANYLGNGVKPNDVEKAMYKLEDTVESELYNKYLIFGKLPDSLHKNTFLKKLISPSKKQALKYYLFIQGVEHLTKFYDDRWNPIPRDSVKLTQRANDALRLASTVSIDFLKIRYYYQAQRLLHYARNYRTALNIYKASILPVKSNSHLKYWSLDLQAAEEFHLGNKALASLLYVKVFMLCPERRIQAFHDFLSIKASLNAVLKHASTQKEKVTIYAIEGLHTPRIGLTALKQVYQTDPRSDFVSVLLVREINKIEETYLTPKISGRNYFETIGYYDHTRFDSLKNQYAAYIPQLQKFCIQLANERKYNEPELGYLAAAYLSWIQGNTNAGLTFLASIKNEGLRGKLYEEKQLIKLLLLSQNIKQLDKPTEARLLPSLLWLDNMVKKESLLNNGVAGYGAYDLKFYSASARDFYSKVIAPIYFKQKDTVMASLCILKSERTIPFIARYGYAPRLAFDLPNFWQNNLHSFQLERILKWNSSAKKTAYLYLLMKNVNQPTTVIISGDRPFKGGGYEYMETRHSRQTVLSALYDLLGTTYLREHKYTAAVKAFRHLNAKDLENSTSFQIDYQPFKIYNSYPIPFIDKLKDYPKVYSNKKRKGYSKLAFAKAMAHLQYKIKTDPKQAARYYYQMALGLYNTSYYGSAWSYTVYQQADSDAYRTNGPSYDRDYLKHYTAEAYFLKARSLSNDNELKARCTFMAAKCAQSQITVPGDYGSYLAGRKYDLNESTPKTRTYDKIVRNNPYFYDLKKQYQKTKFYKTAISDCSYFWDFLASSKPVKEVIKKAKVVVGK